MYGIGSTPAPAKAFLSYSHEDDDVLGFSVAVKKAVEGRFRGTTGRKLEIFRDRDDIPLGNDWREALSNGASNSLIFFACVSGAYLNSAACREEFLEFREAAESADSEGLLIPILPYGRRFLEMFGDDDIAQYTESVQNEDLDDAITKGFESPEFREFVRKVTSRAIEVISAADDRALTTPPSRKTKARNEEGVEASDRGEPRTVGADELEEDNRDGIFEIVERISSNLPLMNKKIEQVAPLVADLGRPFSEFQVSPGRGFSSTDAVRLSREISPISLEIREQGAEVKSLLMDVDGDLRDLFRTAAGTSFDEPIKESLERAFAEVKNTEEVVNQLGGLLNAMKDAEALSSSLRKALRPARRGLMDLGDAATLFESWRTRF